MHTCRPIILKLTCITAIISTVVACTANSETLSAPGTNLGNGLEKMQKLVITTHATQIACNEAFPDLREQFQENLKLHIQAERPLYEKLNEVWGQLERKRPNDVQPYYWAMERRVSMKLDELRRPSSGVDEFLKECVNFFADLKAGTFRLEHPELFSTIDEYVAGKNSNPPTFPALDDIAYKRENPHITD